MDFGILAPDQLIHKYTLKYIFGLPKLIKVHFNTKPLKWLIKKYFNYNSNKKSSTFELTSSYYNYILPYVRISYPELQISSVSTMRYI